MKEKYVNVDSQTSYGLYFSPCVLCDRSLGA